MKKAVIILLLLAVVFSAGCVIGDTTDKEYPDYESYDTVSPPGTDPNRVYLTIGYISPYGDFEVPRYDLASWYSMHPEIKDIIYQWAEETETAIREPEVIHNYLEIGILGKFIDGNPPTVQIRGRYDLTAEEKAQFDELYRRLDDAAIKSGIEDIPVQFLYGAC